MNGYPLKPFDKIDIVAKMSCFNQFRVLVIGDLILDHYVFGEVNRVSPEAPVPVVEHRWEEKRLGGAGNVAANLYSLCGRVMISGVLGLDAPGALFTSMLMGMTDFYGGIIECRERRTTHKMRVLGNRQQLLRLDQEISTPIDRATTELILSFVRRQHGKIDAIVVSDYAKGVVTQGLMDGLVDIISSHERKIPLVIDPKRDDPHLYRGARLLTPNLKEASALANMTIKTASDLEEAGERIVDSTGCELLLITQGPGGMTLFDGLHEPISVPTEARHVYDVSGAGDTVTACMTLGLLSNMGPQLSACFANMAAGMVVGEIGTTTVDPKKIRASLELARDARCQSALERTTVPDV